jgi:hypothetical protein
VAHTRTHTHSDDLFRGTRITHAHAVTGTRTDTLTYPPLQHAVHPRDGVAHGVDGLPRATDAKERPAMRTHSRTT